MQHQAEPPQVGAIATDNAGGQGRKNGLACGRHPAFAPIMDELCLQDQLAHVAAFIPFEAGTRGNLSRQDLLACNAVHVALGSPLPSRWSVSVIMASQAHVT